MIPSMRDVFNHAMKGAIRILLSLFVPTLAFPAWPQSSLSAGTRWLDHLCRNCSFVCGDSGMDSASLDPKAL